MCSDSDLPPDLLSGLVQRSGGNPLFLEESIGMLVESGAIEDVDGRWRIMRPHEIEDVPSAIRRLIAARLDGLPSDEKRILQDASVAGEAVWLGLLEHLVRGRMNDRRCARSRRGTSFAERSAGRFPVKPSTSSSTSSSATSPTTRSQEPNGLEPTWRSPAGFGHTRCPRTPSRLPITTNRRGGSSTRGPVRLRRRRLPPSPCGTCVVAATNPSPTRPERPKSCTRERFTSRSPRGRGSTTPSSPGCWSAGRRL